MDGYNISAADAARVGARFSPGPLHRHKPILKKARPWLPFALCVILPTLIGAIYYTGVASYQYYSDASFIIRSPGKSNGGGGGGALTALLQSSGIARSQDDTYSVNEYLTSRDALAELVRNQHVRDIFSRPEADFLARFPNMFSVDDSFESLYKFFQRHVDVTYDSSSGVTRLEVRTFRPEDSQRVAAALLESGERLLNRLNERALHNAVADSQAEVDRMEGRLTDIEGRLAIFRSRETVIDPAKQSQTMLIGVAQLEEQLAGTQTLVTQLQRSSPGSPLLLAAQRRAAAIQQQIGVQQRRVTGDGTGSMVPRIANFEGLRLEEDIAQKGLSSSVAALETARMEAIRQQLYLDRVVQPNLADRSLYPRRLIAISIIFATFLVLYMIGRMLVSGMREHQVH